MQVSLHNVVIVGVQILDVPCQEYSPALTRCLRLHDESLFLVFGETLKLLAKFAELTRQQPCLRKEVVLVGKLFLHSLHISSEQVFPAQNVHAGKVIYSLIRLHPIQSVALDGSIRPKYVPVFFV